MPIVNVHRYVVAGDRVGGTVEIDDLDLTNGLTVEMRNPPFNATGVWTIISYNTITGPVSNITIDASATGFTAGAPYLDSNTVKVVLS
jgi:hypothetical protein